MIHSLPDWGRLDGLDPARESERDAGAAWGEGGGQLQRAPSHPQPRGVDWALHTVHAPGTKDRNRDQFPGGQLTVGPPRLLQTPPLPFYHFQR